MACIIVLGILWLICGGLKSITIFDKPVTMERTVRDYYKGYENTQAYKDAIEHARYMDEKYKNVKL